MYWCVRRRKRKRENTCKTLKFVFRRWSDAVIDAGHSNKVTAEVAPHFHSTAAAIRLHYFWKKVSEIDSFFCLMSEGT